MTLLSDSSRANIEQALHRAVRTCLLRRPGDTCLIGQASESIPAAAMGERLIVVTISSFKFRLLVVFHIDETASLVSYFVGQHTRGGMEEAFYEIANMCCGALNRDIAREFRHLAMSVPYTLAGACMTYISELRPEYVSSNTVTINDDVRVRVTLCMCCSAPVSFSGAELEVKTHSGELELF